MDSERNLHLLHLYIPALTLFAIPPSAFQTKP